MFQKIRALLSNIPLGHGSSIDFIWSFIKIILIAKQSFLKEILDIQENEKSVFKIPRHNLSINVLDEEFT